MASSLVKPRKPAVSLQRMNRAKDIREQGRIGRPRFEGDERLIESIQVLVALDEELTNDVVEIHGHSAGVGFVRNTAAIGDHCYGPVTAALPPGHGSQNSVLGSIMAPGAHFARM